MERQTGEEVFFHGHPSWRSILGFYAKGVLASALAGALAGVVTAIAAGHVQIGWIIVVVLAGFVIVGTVGLLTRVRTTYTITSQRLTVDTGLLSRNLHEARLDRVQSVNSRQSLFERVLKIGTVDFDTAASSDFDFAFHGVADPERIVRTVDHALKQLPRPSPDEER